MPSDDARYDNVSRWPVAAGERAFEGNCKTFEGIEMTLLKTTARTRVHHVNMSDERPDVSI